MPNLILPSRFTSQPQYPAPIDKSNPLCKGLESVIAPGRENDAVGMQAITTVGAKNIASAKGRVRGFYSTLGTATSDRISATTNLVSAARTVAVMYMALSNGGSGFGRILNRNNTELFFVSSLGITYSRFHNGGIRANSQWANRGTDSIPHMFTVTSDGTSTANVYGYLDGALTTIAAASGSPTGEPAAGDTVFYGNRSAADRGFDGWLGLILQWSRELNAAEVLSLYVNPWQIFQAPARKLYVPDSGVAPTFKAAWAQQRSQVIGVGVH